MSDFKTNCHLCGDFVIKRPAKDGVPDLCLILMRHLMNICRSQLVTILEDIHHRDDEDKTKLIGEMTIQELEDRIKRLSSKEAAMRLGSFLHVTNGFVSKGFEKD